MVLNNLYVAALWQEFFVRYLGRWNTILAILVLSSIFALSIFLERLLYLKRSEIDTSKFVIALRSAISSQNIIEAIRLCEDTGGAIASIVRAGLIKHDRPKEELESSMELMGKVEISKLERNSRILSLVAHIAPLVGLLGTVIGFISAFAEMRKAGLMDISASRIGEAMEYALVTTAAGLLVAIPSFIAYNYLVSRIRQLVLEMDTTSSEVVDLLVRERSV